MAEVRQLGPIEVGSLGSRLAHVLHLSREPGGPDVGYYCDAIPPRHRSRPPLWKKRPVLCHGRLIC